MKMRMSRSIGLLSIMLLILACPMVVSADGTSAGVVLTFPVGARALAMGEAFASIGGDQYALHYNPAAATGMSDPALSFFYEAGSIDDQMGGFVFVYPAGRTVLAGALSGYSSGDLDLTQSDGHMRTVNGQSDHIVTMTLAHASSSRFAAGANVKFLRSTLVEEFSATAGMLDVGCLIRPFGDRYTFGTSVQNLGSGLRYSADDDPLPWVVRVGGSALLDIAGRQATAAIDGVRWRQRDANLHAGIEFWLTDVLGIRSGYRTGYDAEGFTFGFGLELGAFSLDYGADLMQDLNATQIFDLTYTF